MVAVRADRDDSILYISANELLEQSPRYFQYEYCHTDLLRHFHITGYSGVGYFVQRMATHESRRCDRRFVWLQHCCHCCDFIECLPEHRHIAE